MPYAPFCDVIETGSVLEKSHMWHGTVDITVRVANGAVLWKEIQIDCYIALQVAYNLKVPVGSPAIREGVTKCRHI